MEVETTWTNQNGRVWTGWRCGLWHWWMNTKLPSGKHTDNYWTYTFHRQAMLNKTTRILKPIASRTRFHGETINMLWLKRSCYDLKRSQRFHAKTRPLQWLKTKCYDLTLPLVWTNHHFQWVNPLFLWPFSIATLDYQFFWGSLWLFGLHTSHRMFWSRGIQQWKDFWPTNGPDCGYQPKAPTSANWLWESTHGPLLRMGTGGEVHFTHHVVCHCMHISYVSYIYIYLYIYIDTHMYLIIHYMIHAYSTCTLKKAGSCFRFSSPSFRPQERSQPHGCGQSRHSGGMSLHPDLHVALPQSMGWVSHVELP